MGETLYRRPEILFRWGRLCFDTESRGEISYQLRGDSVSGETLFRDTGRLRILRRPNGTNHADIVTVIGGGSTVRAMPTLSSSLPH